MWQTISYSNTTNIKPYRFQSYKQHKFEPDPERVKEIIAKSIEDAKWIVNKVQKVYF